MKSNMQRLKEWSAPMLIFFMVWLFSGCSIVKEMTPESTVEAEIVQFGVINGVPEGAQNEDGEPINFEASAIINLGDRLLIANDKKVKQPNASAILSVPNPKKLAPFINGKYEMDTPLMGASKIEAMAKSPNFDLFFATTAFDRIQSEPVWDNYNMLFYWEGNQFDKARLLFKTDNDGTISSKNLREALHRVLRSRKYPNGVSYFKVEGLAVLPDNSLIMGVREFGPSYQDFDYTCTLVATKFIKTRDGMTIDPDWRKILEFDPSRHPEIKKSFGLSSLEYHAESNSLVALTTFEEEGQPHETLVWFIPVQKRITPSSKPILVTDQAGKPLRLPYKGEGCTFLDKQNLLIVFDEDRNLSTANVDGKMVQRKPHQAFYGQLKVRF